MSLQSNWQPGWQSVKAGWSSPLNGSWQPYFLVGFWTELLGSLPGGPLHKEAWASLNMAGNFPYSKQSLREKARKESCGAYNLILEVTSILPCFYWSLILALGEGNGSPLQTLAWKIPWMEELGRLQSMGLLRVGHNWVTSLSLFTFHALEQEMATHSSVLAWRIPGTGEPGGLPSMGSHRVGHDWSDLAAAAAAY